MRASARVVAATFIVLSVVGVAGCGGGGHKSADVPNAAATTPVATTPAGVPVAPADTVRTHHSKLGGALAGAAAGHMLGGHAVAQCLRNEGVKHIFSVPGESYIAVVDGLVNFPEIKLITNRQEGCAAFMAEGYAKATRTPGVCIVTRGPGATNASIAVHSAATCAPYRRA